MFTGIVTHRGVVREALSREGGARRLLIEPHAPFADVAQGASVAVDGVCLTVVESTGTDPGGAASLLAFDVVPETLRASTLGARVVGDRVHLERALRAGEELGGHWVQGHVEGRGEVASLERRGDDVRLVVRLGPSLLEGMLPKGSVCLDGVSLTVGEVWREEGDDGGRIACYLVPHTLSVTNLGAHAPGDEVNVEPDALGRWVEHHVRRWLGAADAWMKDRSKGGRS